jgi:hypothetical protein
VDHLRHTDENKKIYAQRKETIERVFADAKEKHGMRWTTLRGLKKMAMLTFAAMNLKNACKLDAENHTPNTNNALNTQTPIPA